MANSSTVSSGELATAAQYNDLRSDVVDTSSGHTHDGTNANGGAATLTDTTAPLILKYDAGEYVTHAVSSAGVYSMATTDASSNSGAITLDTVLDITLDSDTAANGIVYADGGTNLLRIHNSSSDVIIKPLVDAKDIIFQQYDGTAVARIEDGGYLNVINTTASSSATTGALIVGGGAGIAADLFVGDDLTLSSDSAVFNMGAGNDFTITHDGTTGATIAGNPLTLDSGADITLDADGADIFLKDGGTLFGTLTNSGGQLVIKSSSSGTTAATFSGANVTLAGTVASGAITSSGIVKTDDTTEATSTTDGSLQTDGGLSVVKDAVFGDDIFLLSDSAVFNMGAGNDFTITHDGTTGATIAGNPLVLDSGADITLDAEGADIFLKDGGTLFGTLTNSSGELVIKSSSSGTTAATFSGANVTLAGTVASGAITSSGIVKTDDATEATSTTDGSLQTDGGLSVVKDAVFGDDVFLLSDSAVLNIGADSDAKLTHDGTSGLTISASPISIDATGELHLNSTTGDIKLQDGGTDQIAFDLDGTSGVVIMKAAVDSDDLVIQQYDGTEVLRIEDAAYLNVSNTTASSSATTGSAIFGGGIGVAADAYVGDDLYLISDSAVLGFGADKDTTLTHTDGTGLGLNSTNKLTFGDAASFVQQSADGTLRIDGEAIIDLNASTRVDVSGDLKVGGEVQTASIGYTDGDNAMTIADGGAVTFPVSIDITGSGGIILENDETITNSTNGLISLSGNLAIPDGGTIGTASDTDAITIASAGAVTFSQQVTVTGNLLPGTDDTYDLGSASAAWQDLFLEGDITFSDAGTISTAGTTDLTVRGGASAGSSMVFDGGEALIGIGGAASDSYDIFVRYGARTTSATSTARFAFDDAGNALTVPSSAARASMLQIARPTFTMTDSLTVATTVYISNAPTISSGSAGNAYALFVDAGDSRFDGGMFIGDSAHEYMDQGLVINQGSATNALLDLKQSGIDHKLDNVLAYEETDTALSIWSGASGGVNLNAFHEDSAGRPLTITAVGGTASTDKDIHNVGLISLRVYEIDGSGAVQTTVTSDGNVFSVAACTSGTNMLTRFIIDEDGDLFASQDGTTGVTVIDEYDDVSLVRALDIAKHDSGFKGYIESEWDEFIQYNEDTLVDVGILGAPIAKGGLINVTGLQRLHNGAIWQIAQRQYELESKLELAERKLAALGA